jgi:hypothetical protein
MTTVPPELLVEQLDACLTDSVRRAANRAEHIRLTRMQELVGQLKEQLPGVVSSVTSGSPTELAS